MTKSVESVCCDHGVDHLAEGGADVGFVLDLEDGFGPSAIPLL